jgi:hypothetical protein
MVAMMTVILRRLRVWRVGSALLLEVNKVRSPGRYKDL